MPHLPFGMALFGGVDGTAKLEDGEALKSTLFSFDKLDPSKYISSQYNYTDFSGATVSVTFDVPPNVDFQWSTSSEVFTVVGESKSEYQKNLSQNFGLSGFASGFGAEVNVSFGEQTFEETYKSYASCYERTIIYRLKIGHADEVRQWLSSTALDLFASGNADHIVEHLGTHYMKSAAFGGLQRASASIDIRDSGITTDLSTAIKLSADLGDKGGSVDAGDKTETATKLHNSFGNTAVTRMGGTSTNDVALWKASINTQPTPVGYELGTLDELITDPTVAAAVKQKIQDVMNEYPVIGSSAVATYFPLSNTVTDSGSGSHSSITCINMAHLQGWYSLGQFALPNYGEDIGQMAGLMVKEGTTVPGQPRAFTDATGLDRKWGMGDPHHLCVANLTAPENYVSISGVFKNGDDWPRAGDWDRLVCVHKDFIKEAVYGDCLWNDHGTGASDCGSIWAITPKPEDENDQKMVKITGNFDKEPRYFKANSGYGKPSDTAYLPNLARIKVLSNSWVADLKA